MKKGTKKSAALILLSLFLIPECGPSQYKYVSLSPVESGPRKAYENYESLKNEDVEIRIERTFPYLVLERLKKEKKGNEYSLLEKVLKRIDKIDYTLLNLKVINPKNKKVIIDPENFSIEFLGSLLEKEYKPISEKDFSDLIKGEKTQGFEDLTSYFLIPPKRIETSDDKEIFLLFPYEIKDEHMAILNLKDISIDNKGFDFEYLFYSADRYEKTKRVGKYVGMATGLIVIVVTAVVVLTGK